MFLSYSGFSLGGLLVQYTHSKFIHNPSLLGICWTCDITLVCYTDESSYSRLRHLHVRRWEMGACVCACMCVCLCMHACVCMCLFVHACACAYVCDGAQIENICSPRNWKVGEKWKQKYQKFRVVLDKFKASLGCIWSCLGKFEEKKKIMAISCAVCPVLRIRLRGSKVKSFWRSR